MKKLRISLSKIGKDRLVILFLAGVLLLIVAIPEETFEKKIWGNSPAQSSRLPDAKDEDPSPAGEADKTDDTDQHSYARGLEARLEELLTYVDGAGKVKVFVYVSESSSKIVEKDMPNERKNVYETGKDGDNKNTMELTNEMETVYTEDENGHKVPFVIRQQDPAVEGVVVVSSGGGNEMVKKQITEAIEALFGIDAHKIKVVKMKGEGQ